MTDWVAGFHGVRAALEGGTVGEVWLAAERRDRRSRELEARCVTLQVPLRRVSRRDLDALDLPGHQGVAARVRPERSAGGDESTLEALLDEHEGPALLLILEGVTDPRNLGACLRSAEAAGATAVVVPRSRTAALTPAARKVASGAAERLPLIRVANLARTLRWLEQRGIHRVGLAGDARTALWDVPLTTGCALLLGAEGSGLRRLTREHCDVLARLPMAGQVESLNVSVAAGIALFEAVRQRRAPGELAPPWTLP